MRRSVVPPGFLLLPIVLAGCGRGAGGAAAEVVVRDSAGVTILEHPASAVEAVPLAIVGEAEFSIGGEEADENSDATFLGRGWLVGDGVLAYHSREARILKFDASGAYVASYGRRGDGPDEFQAMYPLRVPGDSLLLIEISRSNWRALKPDLTVSMPVAFGEGPSFQQQVFGVLPDGTLLAIFRSFEPGSGETSGPPRRHDRPVVRRVPGATAWDTLLTIRGELVYPTTFSEGGQTFPGEALVTLGAFPYYIVWGDALVTVDNSDRTIEVRNTDGSLRQSVRFATPLRPLTQEIRDSAFARDIRMAERFQAPEAMKAQFLERSRNQVFADSVAPYDRIMVGREGRLWLRLNETPADSATVWHAIGPDGRLAARLQLSKGWMLLDSDGDRILIRRTDDLELGYLEIRRLVTPGREGDGGTPLPSE